MSHRVTISVPDDVADQIAAFPPRQVPTYRPEGTLHRRAAEEMRATLAAAGYREFPYEPKAAAKRLQERRITPETQIRAIIRLAEMTGRPVAQVFAEFNRRVAE